MEGACPSETLVPTIHITRCPNVKNQNLHESVILFQDIFEVISKVEKKRLSVSSCASFCLSFFH